MNRRKIFVIALIAVYIAAFIMHITEEPSAPEVILSQKANSSSGSYWEYELSNTSVIEEIDYYTSRFPFNFAGYEQHWKFRVIGEGEVTIHWLAYDGGDYSADKSYSETYIFDSRGDNLSPADCR